MDGSGITLRKIEPQIKPKAFNQETSHETKVLVGCTLLCETVLTAILVAVAMLCLHSHRVLFEGIIADVFNVIMYALPLAIWKKVFDTRSVEYMPFWLSLAGLSNGVCWTIYALIQFEIFILVSNGLGSILGAIQLGLYAYFYFNGNDKATEQVKKPSELQLSNQPRGAA
ncbi:Cyclophilin 38 isoform 1 [Hibiscus syriacus]|uniref:Cyclophilin 38 isoform 1 n=1 Tax=Hibiscus syriacus TaxID=106335 RepID=A0A6A2XR05_HIBSY|nr:bidirectional sugar transporter SWEET4-like [Hibiscus syriacus]KAE8677992.1 Cyclophilin 38 isoform 1 [Hibiscus syriacus]